MMIHQDGSRHEWVPGQMWDLIVTMDDATSEIVSMKPAFSVIPFHRHPCFGLVSVTTRLGVPDSRRLLRDGWVSKVPA